MWAMFVLLFEFLLTCGLLLMPCSVFGDTKATDNYQNDGRGDTFTNIMPLFAGIANLAFFLLLCMAFCLDGYDLKWFVVVWWVRIFTDLKDFLDSFTSHGGMEGDSWGASWIGYTLFCLVWVAMDIMALRQVVKKLMCNMKKVMDKK